MLVSYAGLSFQYRMIRQVVSGNRVLKLPDKKLLEAKTLTTGEINRNADGSANHR